MKQSELARKAKIKESVLSDYVNAKRFPRPGNFAAIARGLGCTPQQLEEQMWQVRTESQARKLMPSEADPAQLRFHELLFRGKLGDPDPRLENMLEEVRACAYHFQLASSRFAAAMGMLVEYMANRKPPAAEN